MKKVLLLISLSLFLVLSVRAEEDIQALCKEQREKVNEMVKTIASIRDQSIRSYLNQVCIDHIIEDINKQATSKEKDLGLNFDIYYNSGHVIAFQKIDEKIQAYKKDYDNLPDWKKSETVNPYEPLYIKNGDDWDDNPKNYISFYFSLPDNPNPKYTINNLRSYLQEYVECAQITKEDEHINQTNKITQFYNDNKLWAYAPQELSDLIIQVILELDKVKYATNDFNWCAHFLDLWDCSSVLWWGLHTNITLQKATKEIKTAVYALSPFKYNDIMEALNLEFKQKGMSDTQANKEAEKKLDNIIQIYANKLVEKAKGGQNVQIKR